MANTRKKNFKKIRRVGWVGSLVTTLLLMMVITGFFAYAIFSFVRYALDTKISNEYDKIEYMAQMYDSADTDDIYKYLDMAGRDYMVVDKDNNVLHSKGENTCSFKGDKVKIRVSEPVMIYEDTAESFVYPDDGEISLRAKEFFDMLSKTNHEEVDHDDHIDALTDEDEFINDEAMKEAEETLKAPIWMSVDVKGGKEKMVVKAYYRVNRDDILLIGVTAVAVVILTIVIFIIMIIKIIRNVMKQRKLLKLYFTDDITGRKNRAWYLLKGEQRIRKFSNRNKKFAVVSLVFVNYRNYCICHSMKKGEEMLRRIHEILDESLDKKEISARMSSSGFALLLAFENEDTLKNRLDVLVERLEHIDTNHKFDFQLGVDLVECVIDEKGRAHSRKDIEIEQEYNNACMARESIGNADESGIVFFDNTLVEERIWIDNVQDHQKKALDNEEFAVYYQPKYDPRTNELRGAEALIRWISPEYGFVSPGRFIPIFEKNGFITEIDHYMITHVARDQKEWLDQGKKCVPVSVNVSRAHFIESDLAEQIRDMVDKEGTPHELVEIELTESAFFDDKNQLVETIKRLKEYGFTVSMDDFGSGYSSLNSLKDMPLDVLKLDAEFFRGENEGDRGEIVVSEAIRLAKQLNMRTVAEGVEIKEQVDFLAKEGCDMIQGFYYAKPMPKDEFELVKL